MIRRPPRSTQSRSSAASDVYKRQRLLSLRSPRSRMIDLTRCSRHPVTTYAIKVRWQRVRSRLRPLISTRRVVVVAVILLAVGVGTSAWAATRSPAAAAYQLVAASPGTIRQTVAATGVLQPARQANLSFAVSGQVTAVNVAVGDQVSAAQSLASLRAPSLATQVAQSQATVATDQARLTADQTAGASSCLLYTSDAADDLLC